MNPILIALAKPLLTVGGLASFGIYRGATTLPEPPAIRAAIEAEQVVPADPAARLQELEAELEAELEVEVEIVPARPLDPPPAAPDEDQAEPPNE